MLVKCQTLGAALLAAASLGTLFSAGCAAKPPASASAPTSAIAEHQAAPEAASNRLQREPANSSDAVRLGLISKTSALIGRKVLTRQENSLGRVDDLVLDLSTGQAVAVLVSAGPDEHLTPVPARSFWTASRNKILVSTDQKTFESAPHFPKADSMLALEAGRLAESFRHFGQKAPEPPAPGSDGYCSAAGLAALRLVSQTKEPLGQVAEIMVDVPVGRIAYLVIQPAVGIGSSNDLYVVPPQSVRADAAGRSLVLNADPAYFLAGPYFQRDFPAEMSRPEVTAAMLLHYNVQPGLPGEADPTHQQVRARIEAPGAPADAPAARSDQEITAAIVTEFVRNSGAFPTRDFKIITTQGHVTLSGHVGSESKKQQLGAAAARVVGAENVDNQLNHPPGRGS